MTAPGSPYDEPVTRPLLSIVTPCLNSAATLPEALASVRSQGLDGNVEHVVVDGGSDDGTVEILRQAPEVDWVSEPDRGLSDAMNKGVGRAGGEFVGWLNADDYYLPGALDRVRAALEARPDAVWVTAPCLIVNGAGHEIRNWVTRYKRFFLRHYSRRSLLVQNYIAAPATFARRDAILEAGGFDERFKYSMDYDLWLKLADRADPIVLDEPVAAFRMAGESLSMTGFERQFREHAQNARERGRREHLVAVAANGFVSRAIILVYRLMRALRRASPG
jgi:glycosyltransferase involved in cell wall biosynthesis